MALLLLLVAIDCSPTNKSDVIPSNETAADDAVVKLFCNGSYFLRGASVVCEGNAIISGCTVLKIPLEVNLFWPQVLIVNVSEIR